MEKHHSRNELVQIYRKQTTLQLYLFRHRRVLSIHQPRPPKQSTRLRLRLWQHHHRRKKHFNPRKKLHLKHLPWQKKGNTTFDVTMGSYDGAETCELVGSFLLSQLQDLNINVGLYRDDGLAITNTTPRDTENIKKEICRIFNNNGLRITIEANKQIINFLDVTFNLNRSTYQPFTKPNTSLQYVHRESNHPPITINNISTVPII